MNGVGVLGWLFRYGCGCLLAISASETGWIICYLSFRRSFPLKASEWCWRAKVSKSNMVIVPPQVPGLWLCRAFIPGEGFNFFQFHDVCGMERQFNVFSVVVDILELASSP